MTASPEDTGEADAQAQEQAGHDGSAVRPEEHIIEPQIKEEEKDIEWDSDKEAERTIPSDEGSKSRPTSIDDITREDGIAAIREVFSAPESSAGLDRETAIREVAAAIGFERVGPRIRQFIEGDLIAAARRGVIFSDSGMLYPAYRSITEYPRDLLKKCLLSVMGSAWWDQDEAIRAVARYLGFRRTGSAIQKAFKSAITGAIRQGLLERDGRMIRAVK